MLGKMLSNLAKRPLPVAPASEQQETAAPAPASAEPQAQAQPVAAAPDYSYNLYVSTTQHLIASILAQPEHADPRRLERYGWKAYSQNDEDGILQEIFRRIGVRHRSFVEFGSGYGLENNTAYLLSQGWRGLWMDGDEVNAQRIEAGFRYLIDRGLLQFKRAFIDRDNINGLIADAALGPEVDLLSIDLDGNDYYVWEAINAVNPRVVGIEYNAKFRPPHDWCLAYAPDHAWTGSDQMGCSLAALVRLGTAKGYRLVGCGIVGVNAFFVRGDLAGDHFTAPATAENLFQPPRYYLTVGFQGGHPPNSRTIVEGASVAAGLPWPPTDPRYDVSIISR